MTGDWIIDSLAPWGSWAVPSGNWTPEVSWLWVCHLHLDFSTDIVIFKWTVAQIRLRNTAKELTYLLIRTNLIDVLVVDFLGLYDNIWSTWKMGRNMYIHKPTSVYTYTHNCHYKLLIGPFGELAIETREISLVVSPKNYHGSNSGKETGSQCVGLLRSLWLS